MLCVGTLPSVTLNDIIEYGRERLTGKTWRIVIFGNERATRIQPLQKFGAVEQVPIDDVFGK